MNQREDELVLAVAQAGDRLRARPVARVTLGQCNSTCGEERANTVVPLFAVYELVVVLHSVEGDEGLTRPFGPRAQEVIEHRLPRLGVHCRSLREHAIKIEQARVDLARQSQHRAARQVPSRRLVTAKPISTAGPHRRRAAVLPQARSSRRRRRQEGFANHYPIVPRILMTYKGSRRCRCARLRCFPQCPGSGAPPGMASQKGGNLVRTSYEYGIAQSGRPRRVCRRAIGKVKMSVCLHAPSPAPGASAGPRPGG